MAKGNVEEHTQIIEFTNGSKKTIKNVVRIDEGQMIKLTTKSGHEFLIDRAKVNWVERYIEPKAITDKLRGDGYEMTPTDTGYTVSDNWYFGPQIRDKDGNWSEFKSPESKRKWAEYFRGGEDRNKVGEPPSSE